MGRTTAEGQGMAGGLYAHRAGYPRAVHQLRLPAAKSGGPTDHAEDPLAVHRDFRAMWKYGRMEDSRTMTA